MNKSKEIPEFYNNGDDLVTFMQAITIAARNKKELDFVDHFLIEYENNQDIVMCCYKSLIKSGLIVKNK